MTDPAKLVRVQNTGGSHSGNVVLVGETVVYRGTVGVCLDVAKIYREALAGAAVKAREALRLKAPWWVKGATK